MVTAVGLAAVAAAAGGALQTADPVSVLLNGGVLGVIVALFLAGQLATGREVRRLERERDQAHEELAHLRQNLEDRLLPALIRSTDLLAGYDARELARRREEGRS